jgi:serine/threonine protein kinase
MKPARKTRRKHGGELLGKGAHGITYNVGCNNTDKTICSILSRLVVSEAILFDENGTPHILSEPNDLRNFEQYLDLSKDKIAKILINHEYLGETHVEKEFHNELNENLKINAIYGAHSENYTTIGPVATFNGINVYGSIIRNDKETGTYILFGNKCSKKGTMTVKDLDKYIIDILESIVILQSNNYAHNDIKLDNTVLCGTKYKLIDWGVSGSIDTVKVGTLLGTNPVKWYIYGLSPLLAESAISYRTHQRYWDFARSQSFTYINNRIVEQFTKLLAETSDKVVLHERFKNSFDIFMLGMAVLHATHMYNLPFSRYEILIRIFVSLRNPVENATTALSIAKSILEEKKKNKKH